MTQATPLDALEALSDLTPTDPETAPPAFASRDGATFTWSSANNGNFYGGWSLGGVPEAGDTADMSVTGAPYTVLCDNFSTTSDGGTFTVTDYVVGSVILGVDTTLEIDANSFDLQTGGTNNGEILVDYALTVGNSGSNTVKLVGSGGGEINLNDDYTNATLTGYGSSAFINLYGQTIVGAGTISNLTLSINKTSGIDATGTKNQFVLDPGGVIYNEGSISANTGATLIIESVTVDESGFVKGDAAGIIESLTPTSNIELDSVHIEGGGLYGYGLLQFDDASSIVDGSTTAGAVTILGNVLASSGDTVTFKGLILNHGDVEIQQYTQLTIDPAGVTFSSGGVGAKGLLSFDDSANVVNSNGSAVTLTNVDNTISGAVSFYNTTIVNGAGGTIDATGTNNQMVIGGSDVLKNSGLLEATGAAGLSISSQVIDAALGGTLMVGAGSQIQLTSDTFDGGVISAVGSGKWVLEDAGTVLDGSTASGAVTLKTQLAAAGGDTLTLRGTLHNESLLIIDTNTQLTLEGVSGVTLDSGGLTTKGSVFFDDTANVVNSTGALETLTNVDNTIAGSVTFYNTTIVNEVGGTIEATGTTNQIVIGGSDILKNSGLLEATGAAGLSITSQTIDAALGGTLTVTNGSQIDLYSDTFDGGVISATGSGKWVIGDNGTVLDGSTSSGAVTLKTELAAAGGDTLTLRGTLHNESLLIIETNTQLTLEGASGVTLDSGGLTTKGSLTFDDTANVVNSTGALETLTNVDNTIAGSVTFYNTTIVNQIGGTIEATGATNQIVIGGSDVLKNSGVIKAIGAAGLSISSQVIDGALGGTLLVGDGSQIDLYGDTFEGGVISAVGTGKWVLGDNTSVLDGTTASGAVTLKTTLKATGGDTLTLKGVLHNEGTLSIQSNTQLTIDGATGVTLDSGGLATKGKLTFDDSGNVINSTGALETLTNVDNTISGSVTIYNTNLINEAGGTIDATGTSVGISIGGSDSVTNAGLIEATGSAGLSISSTTVKNAGGVISAGAGSKVQLYSDLISLGALKTSGSGIIEIGDSGTTLSAGTTTHGLNLAATIQIDDSQSLAITGSVVNSGKIEVGVTGAATLELGASLSGGGSIVMFDSASSAITVGLDNIDNTISGAGTISAHVQQEVGGVIEATHLDNALILATGAAITNAGTLEANAGLLIVENDVLGTGHVVITNGGTATFDASLAGNVSFVGAAAGTLQLTEAYMGTITGFGVGDAIDLLGLAGDSVTLNASNQLVVKSGATTVATLQLSGNYAGDVFETKLTASGVEIFELPTPTIAQYLGNKAFYDGLTGGFEIVDSAANIQNNLAALGADAKITVVASNSGAVTVSATTFTSAKAALDKVSGGVTVSDTATNLVAALNTLVADAAHIHAIIVSSGSLALSTSQFNTYRTALAGFGVQVAILDTAANILADLSTLKASVAGITSLAVSSGALVVTAAQFTTDQVVLDKLTAGFTIADTAQNIDAAIDQIAADSAHILAVNVTGAVVVTAAQAIKDRATLDKIPGGYSISDSATNIQTNLATLFLDAGKIVAIVSTSGAVTVSAAVFASDRTLLDKITTGFVVSDSAANILANLSTLASDGHISKIIAVDAVKVSMADFLTKQALLDKISNGFVISDASNTILANLTAVKADVANIQSIELTGGTTLTITTALFADGPSRAVFDKITIGFTVADSAANVLSSLAALQADASHVSSVKLNTGDSLSVSANAFANNRIILDKVVGGFAIADTAAAFVANLDLISADLVHITGLAISGAIVVSAAQAVKDRTVLDNVSGTYAISDTAANIQAALPSLIVDNAKISAITATTGNVSVSDGIFDADQSFLNKIAPKFIVQDTGATLVADLAQLQLDKSHIASLVATDAPASVNFTTYGTYTALLNKFTGGIEIKDVAATIKANFVALTANIAHIADIVSSNKTLKVSAATFTAYESVMDKVKGGVAVSDTVADIVASAQTLLGDLGSIQSLYLTDVGTPVLKLSAFEVGLVQPILGKIANNYVLDYKVSQGVFVTTGHGDGLTISDVGVSDTITGSGSDETFAFGPALGHATLVDFSQHLTGSNQDTIQLTATDFGTFHLLKTTESTQHGSDLWLTSSTTGDVIVIDNLNKTQLTTMSANFKFV